MARWEVMIRLMARLRAFAVTLSWPADLRAWVRDYEREEARQQQDDPQKAQDR